MPESGTIKKIYDEVKSLKEDVSFIKEHMFDPDMIMTSEESKRFEQSMKELKDGKTIPFSKLKKELGL